MNRALTLNKGRENVEPRNRKKWCSDRKLGVTDIRGSSVPYSARVPAMTLLALVERLGEVHFPDLMSWPLRTLKTRTSIDKMLRRASVKSSPDSLWTPSTDSCQT